MVQMLTVKEGTELKGMVIVGGVAPDDWPPAPKQVADTAAVFGLPSEVLTPHLHEVFYLDQAQQTLVLSMVQRIADILAHLATGRGAMAGKLESITELAISKEKILGTDVSLPHIWKEYCE